MTGEGPAERTPRDGRARGVNLLTVTPAWRYPFQSLKYLALRLPDWLVEPFTRNPSLGTQLHRLNFLYNARFVYIGRFGPRRSWFRRLLTAGRGRRAPRRESFRHRWTLFAGNFDEPWRPYMQTFLDATGRGVQLAWGDAIGYPGYPRPDTRYQMLDWADNHLVWSQHYYCAYPEAAAFDIRAATELDRELRAEFGTDFSIDTVDSERRAALLARAAHAITIIPGSERHPSPTPGERSATGVSGFIATIPLHSGAATDVARLLTDLEPATFAGQPGTHFVRLGVIDGQALASTAVHGITLRNDYLLFGADFDGDFGLEGRVGIWKRRYTGMGPAQFPAWAGDLAEHIRANAALAAIFDRCYGYEDNRSSPRFERWLAQHLAKRLVYYDGLPDETVASIRAGIATSRAVVDELSGIGPGGSQRIPA